MQILEHLRQLFLYDLSQKEAEKEKTSKRGKKEYDKKRIVKILIFGMVFNCVELC